MSQIDSFLCNGNEKYDLKIRDIENLLEIMNSHSATSAPPNIENLVKSCIQTYSKEISPLLVQKILDVMLLYLNKFDFIEIPVADYVNYMIYNSSAKGKYRNECEVIFKKLYSLVHNELLTKLSDVIATQKVVFVLHTIEIIQFLMTQKQFGPIQKRFAQFSQQCTPLLLKTIQETSNANLKRGCFDLLSDLVKEIGKQILKDALSQMDIKKATSLKEEIEKKLQITIESQNQEQEMKKPIQISIPKIEDLEQSTNQSSIQTSIISRRTNILLEKPQLKEEASPIAIAQGIACEYYKNLKTQVQQQLKPQQTTLKTQVESKLIIANKLLQLQDKPSGRDQLLEQKRMQITVDKLNRELNLMETVIYQDYNKFSQKCNKDKFILISTLYENLTNGSFKLGETPITAQTLLEFFQFENTKGISLSIKILKIFLMVQENSMDKMKNFFQSTLQDILVAAIKNVSVSRRVLLYQVISLFQMIYELKVFNNELLSSIFVTLISEQTKTQRNALDILSNFIMRNQITSDPIYDQILSEIAELASFSPKSQIRTLGLQILVQAQQQIGDRINHYIGRLRFCQLRSFKKATQPIEDKTQELNLKEKSKCCEIESMICQEFIKNEGDLIKLIQNEISFYNKRQQSEFSLNYVKIFTSLLQKPSKYVVKNALTLLNHTYQQFKPSEILCLFDVIMNIKSCIDPCIYRLVLVQMIQYQGFSIFYSQILEYLSQKKVATNLITILRYLVNDINDFQLTEIIEAVLKLIDENQIQLNNIIYHFLALCSMSRGEQRIENIILDKYFFADHLLKKVQREKEKCLYLIHLSQKNKQSSTTLSNRQSQNFDMINFDLDIESFMSQNQEEMIQKFSSFENSKIIPKNLEEQEESDNYSFVEAEEDEI